MSALPCTSARRPTQLGSAVHWTPAGGGVLYGRMPGRSAGARVTTNGFVVTVELEFAQGHLEPQVEFRNLQVAKAAAEQWLSLIT